MAILQLETGEKYQAPNDINRELATLHIQLQQWSVGKDIQLLNLLAQTHLNETEKDLVLQHLDRYCQQLPQTSGYQLRDLIALHPQTPDLATLLAKFSLVHTHADDEVRYIIAGEGVFGLVRPDSSQVELTVQAGDYINIPANTEHWFYLTASRTFKAVRYFMNTDAWIPQYTDTPLRMLRN
jgi:1,2-dihydroxy-3-keto-5-methylthiopentene dioxygenase